MIIENISDFSEKMTEFLDFYAFLAILTLFYAIFVPLFLLSFLRVFSCFYSISTLFLQFFRIFFGILREFYGVFTERFAEKYGKITGILRRNTEKIREFYGKTRSFAEIYGVIRSFKGILRSF